MIHQRTPAVAESVVTALGQEGQLGGGCVGELRDAAVRLDHEGFWWRPSWEAPAVRPYCCSSGALEVTLRTERWCSSGVRPNSPGVHHRSTSVLCSGVGTPASALPISDVVCEGCGATVDIHGHNRAACMRTTVRDFHGRLTKSRISSTTQVPSTSQIVLSTRVGTREPGWCCTLMAS